MMERPILFSGPMVQAILAGRKTMTRRIAKHIKELNIESYEREEKLFTSWTVKFEPGFRKIRASHSGGLLTKEEALCFIANEYCPHGRIGDRLWVREAFGEVYDICEHPEMDSCPDERWHIEWKYRADSEQPVIEHGYFTGWKPSIHMPREVSRIVLEITDIRIERLQDISEADALAEGVEPVEIICSRDGEKTAYRDYEFSGIYPNSPKDSFKSLWRKINGADSWAANPWVWVVEFKVIQGGDL